MLVSHASANAFPFAKMDGTGNDFVILDARGGPVRLSRPQIRQIADRANAETGGCDQVIVLEPDKEADLFLRIFNADGSEAAACGNATRCTAWLLTSETGRSDAAIRTRADLLRATVRGDDVTVNMGRPRVEWHEIPLAAACDTLHLDMENGPLRDPVGVGMGNPHAVFFVDDPEAVDLAALGPDLEHHPLFPERANVGVAKMEAPERIALRVWERGAGETLSCGTGACAAMVAAQRRGLCGAEATVRLRGGELRVAWAGPGQDVLMSGPVRFQRRGTLKVT